MIFEQETPSPSGGILGSIRRLLESTSSFCASKLDLIGLELQAEKRRLLELLILAATALVFGILALTVLTFTIAVIFWEDHRIAALLIVFGIYAAISIGLFIRLQRKINLSSKIFDTSVEEFQKDTEWVRKHL